jgi:MFS family permease
MRRKASLSVIFLTVFIDLMGFGILIPILPTFASKALGISDFGIGTVVAVYSLMQFLFNPVLGKISDKIGRRPLILISLFTTFVSYLMFSFAGSFVVLLLSRLIAGIGGSNIGVAQAYIADVTPKSDRSKGMGMIGAAFGLGFVFGPLIGGLLSGYSYQVAGFGAAGFSLFALIFALFALPESLKDKQPEKEFKLKIFDVPFTIETFKQPLIGFLIFLTFILVFSMANIYGTFSIIGYKVYHFTDQEIGMLFGIIGIEGALIQGVLIRKISKLFEDRTLVLTGILFMSIGLGLIPYGGSFWGLAVVASVLAVGTGLLQPTLLSMISKHSEDHLQGAVLGINHSMSSLARVLGPLWGGFAYDFLGYQFPFLTGGAFAFLTLLATIFLLNSKRLKQLNYVQD